MSAEDLIGAFAKLSTAAEGIVSKLGAVSEAAATAGSALEGMSKTSASILDEMKNLAENADLSLWLVPLIESFEKGKLNARELAELVAQIKLELLALKGQGAGPLLGDFEQELQRLLTLIGELTGLPRG